nr:unnamed protein product [Callosobruchus chinensis]
MNSPQRIFNDWITQKHTTVRITLCHRHVTCFRYMSVFEIKHRLDLSVTSPKPNFLRQISHV